jgi:hypothetical protein
MSRYTQRNQNGFFLRDFLEGQKIRGGRLAAPQVDAAQAALLFFGMGLAAFCVFALAANSCLTLDAMASVLTLYRAAASSRAVVPFCREAGRRMAASTSIRERVLHRRDEDRQ